MLEAARIVELVEEDVTVVLRGDLPADPELEGGGFTLAEPTSFARDLAIRDERGTVAAVAWQWKGIHRGLFGIAPTNEVVIVRGATLVAGTDEEPALHRYIDWLDVLGQIGMTVSPRPIVDVTKAWSDVHEIPELRPHIK